MSRLLQTFVLQISLVEIVAVFPANSCDTNCASFLCVPGTFQDIDPAFSECNLTGYYAFDQGAFLVDSSVSQTNLVPYLDLPTDIAPVQSSNCLFSNGCASFSSGGFKAGNLKIIAGQGLSICSWYEVSTEVLRYERLFDFGNGPYLDNILLGRLSTTNTLYLAVFDSVGTPLVNNQPVSTTAFAYTGQWSHYCLTYDGSFTFKVYLNGAMAASFVVTEIDSSLRTSDLIGKSNWAGDQPFSGLMDDFRMYARTLTPTEVSALYNWRDNYGRCAPCGLGTFASAAGQTACTPCPAGYYGDGCGLTVCTPCPPGNYSSLAGQTVCTGCNAGTFNTGTAAAHECACVTCGGGTYSTAVGATTCQSCLAGKYAQSRVDACGLIGWYQFEPGAFLDDSSGSGELGTLLTPSIAPTQTSNAAVGSGAADLTNGGYFEFGTINLAALAQLSVCAWYRPGTVVGSWQVSPHCARGGGPHDASKHEPARLS